MRFNGSISCVIVDYVKAAKFEQKLSQKKIEAPEAKPKEPEHGSLEDKKLADIKNKMKLGIKLCFDEKVFIQVNALDLYQKAMKIEEERDEFRRLLANCQTREEAQRVQVAKSMELQTETKNKGDLEFITMRMMRMMGILGEYSDFINSEEYDYLPNEKEINNFPST